MYDNGMERDIEANKIIRPPTSALITKATSQDMHRRRQEKTAQLLRKKITDATRRVSSSEITNSSEAMAEAGSILWEEIVLAPEENGVYPRDRLDAFMKIGSVAGLISNARERGDPEKTPAGMAGAAIGAEVGRVMADFLRDALTARSSAVIDATASPVDDEPTIPAQLCEAESDED